LGYNWDYDGGQAKYLVDGYSSQIRFSDVGTISCVVSPNGTAGQQIASTIYALNINNQGYVGIGTTSPYDKLHVASGNIRLDSGYELYFTDNGQIRSYDDNHRILFRRDENKLEFREFGDIIFSTNVTDGNENAKMVILANGNVGIGTSSTCPPSEKLAVNGKIHVQDEIIIDNNGWCDYVYSPEYKFLTIPELEKYLLKYKHMPGVKSASEMEKSGFTVLETNKQMMEKIEELSLYIIQLEKRISELEKK